MKKHHPSLVAAIRIPASDGPIRRAMFTIDELMAMALPRSARSSTICTMNDWRPGISKALMMPCSTLKPRIQGMVMVWLRREPGKRERLDHGEGLRPHQDLPPVEAVDPYSGKGSNQKRGNLAAEAHRPQQQRRMRKPVDQPRRGDARHPRADQRNALAAEKEAEVAMPQRSPRMRRSA